MIGIEPDTHPLSSVQFSITSGWLADSDTPSSTSIMQLQESFAQWMSKGCQLKTKKDTGLYMPSKHPSPKFCIDFWVVNEKQYPFKTDPSNIQSSITVDSTDRSPRCRLQGKRLLSVQAWCFFIANSLPVDGNTQCCCCFRKKQCFIRFAKMFFCCWESSTYVT